MNYIAISGQREQQRDHRQEGDQAEATEKEEPSTHPVEP
jgi:hypothetical protein